MTKDPSKRKNQTLVEGSVEAFTSRGRAFKNGECLFKKVEYLSSKQGKITKQDKTQVVYELRNEYSVKALLQLADIPRSTYYYEVKRLGMPDKDSDLKELDLYNGEIITYTIGSRPVYSLVSTMLEQAFMRLTDIDTPLMHSDQGWHYQMKQYRHALKKRGIKQSMSRKGNCYDNAVIENFFGIMKSEFLYFKEFKDITHFKQELSKYIDYYNNKRIKAKLKGMSPVQYRNHAQQVA